MKQYDAYTILQTPEPPPIRYLVEGLIPLGIVGDIYSMPGAGKSSLILPLASAIASNAGTWQGFNVVGGRVVYIGGEKSNKDVWNRDLRRAQADIPEPGLLTVLDPDFGLWKWNKKTQEWEDTKEYHEAVEVMKAIQPVLVIIDTISLVAVGNDGVDTNQQVQLVCKLNMLRELLNTTILTISHTNQASDNEKLHARLAYTSRSGGNGIPGRFRWLLGLTELNLQEKEALEIGEDRKIIAVAVSKNSEMPQPLRGNRFTPLLFELTADGVMTYRSYISTSSLNAKMLQKKEVVAKAQRQSARRPDNYTVSTRSSVAQDTGIVRINKNGR